MQALRKSDIEAQNDEALLGQPKSFAVVKDKKTNDLCNEYLARAWDGKRELRALAKNLGVTTGSICALLSSTQKIGGKQTRVLHAIFEGSPHMSSLLLDVGAVPDNVVKGWTIPCFESCINPLREKLSSYFGLVLCNEGNSVGIYENQFFREVPKQGVKLLEDAVMVKACVLKNAIVEVRPQDKLEVESIEVFDSVGFVPLKGMLTTKLPWVVAQFKVDNGKPRYGMFNTISCKMDAVTFGHNSAGTKVLLDRINLEMKLVGCPPHEIITID